MIRYIFFAAAVLFLASAVRPGHAQWVGADDKDVSVTFDAPLMYGWIPRKSVYIDRVVGARAEWLCARKLSDTKSNYCVASQSSSQGFSRIVSRASDIMRFYNAFGNERYRVADYDSAWKFDSPLGEGNAIRFETQAFDGRWKQCVAFTIIVRRRHHFIHGWYCGPVETELRDSNVKKLLLAVGLRGRYEPEPVSYEFLNQDGDKFEHLRGMQDEMLCSIALRRSLNGENSWEIMERSQNYVEFAVEKGFTPDSCAALIGRE